MKKNLFSIALLAMSLMAVPAMAKNNASANPSQQKECVSTCNPTCKAAKGKKAEKGNKAAKGKKEGRQAKSNFNPYSGLNLTEAQQSQLRQLDQSRRSQRMEKAKVSKEQRATADSVRMAQRVKAKREYLDGVKAIVGPDQYVIFLENMYINGAPQHNKAKAANHHPKGHKGERPKGQNDSQG